MTDNEFLLFDRITKIKSVIEEWGGRTSVLALAVGKTVLCYII